VAAGAGLEHAAAPSAHALALTIRPINAMCFSHANATSVVLIMLSSPNNGFRESFDIGRITHRGYHLQPLVLSRIHFARPVIQVSRQHGSPQ
jgi:hypothetical protein